MNTDLITAGKTRADVFLAQLRAATADSHKSLEQIPVSAALLLPGLSAEQYAYYLNLMHDVVKSLEENVFPVIKAVIGDLDGCRKLSAVESDLAQIGVSKTNHRIVFAGEYSVPFALGIAYVVEGSTLGGRFILKHVQSVLGYDENRGASYFYGYGNKTGSSWKQFLNQLTAYETAHDCGREIIAGADYAFKTIHNHLSGK